MKSANPLSGEIPINCALFCGFDCRRRHTGCFEKLKISMLDYY
jgi:hypothetical protein